MQPDALAPLVLAACNPERIITHVHAGRGSQQLHPMGTVALTLLADR
jgi:hypothetical protein